MRSDKHHPALYGNAAFFVTLAPLYKSLDLLTHLIILLVMPTLEATQRDLESLSSDRHIGHHGRTAAQTHRTFMKVDAEVYCGSSAGVHTLIILQYN